MVNSVYLAGSVNHNWHARVISSCPGLEFYSPADHGLKSPEQYTAWDLSMVRKADILFAYMDESNPSGFGLATEVGYAKGLGKLVIMVDEKSPTDYAFAKRFAFVRNTADIVFSKMDDGIYLLKTFGFPVVR